MLNNSDEMLNKIASWDYETDAASFGLNDSIEQNIYKQFQDYFKRLFLYFDNISHISQQLNIVAQDFIRESGQVEQVAIFLKSGAEKQTVDIEKSVKLVEQFTDKINNIFERSRNIISLAYDMDKNNQSVRESITQLVINQGKNDEAVQDIFEVIKSLINKTRRIGEVTNLINRISSETKLLGLNAKVEAVHAGAAGRGFSVVAGEIQRLSQETKNASVDISNTILSVTDEINLLENVALKSQGIFAAQRDSVNDVNNTFEKNAEFISTYINEQVSFNSDIEKIKSDEDVLVNSISNIFSSVREVSATAQEISSLTYNQNNNISLLGKLEDDLSADITAINQQSQHIKVQKLLNVKRKIAIIYDTYNAFWDPTTKEAIKAAEIYNYDVTFYAPKMTGTDRIKEMAGFLDQIIEKKLDGLVISPIDDELIYQRLKRLNSIGTKIVFINSKIKNIDYVSTIQTDGIALGAAAARVVIGALGSQGEVIVNTWSDMHIESIENRKNGFIQELKKNTNIQVHEVAVNSKPSENEDRTIDSILRRIPNAKFIFLTNSEWGLAVSKYMRNHHSNVQVITVSYTEENKKAMSEGLIHYCIGQRSYSWGSMAINFIDKSFQNKPVKKYVDTGTYEVNQQNMSIYNNVL